jgi:hypothetical protein
MCMSIRIYTLEFGTVLWMKRMLRYKCGSYLFFGTCLLVMVSFFLLSLPLLAFASPANQERASKTTTSKSSSPTTLGSFTPSAAFPSGVFKDFYSGFEPSATSVEPQPKVSFEFAFRF